MLFRYTHEYIHTISQQPMHHLHYRIIHFLASFQIIPSVDSSSLIKKNTRRIHLRVQCFCVVFAENQDSWCFNKENFIKNMDKLKWQNCYFRPSGTAKFDHKKTVQIDLMYLVFVGTFLSNNSSFYIFWLGAVCTISGFHHRNLQIQINHAKASFIHVVYGVR